MLRTLICTHQPYRQVGDGTCSEESIDSFGGYTTRNYSGTAQFTFALGFCKNMSHNTHRSHYLARHRSLSILIGGRRPFGSPGPLYGLPLPELSRLPSGYSLVLAAYRTKQPAVMAWRIHHVLNRLCAKHSPLLLSPFVVTIIFSYMNRHRTNRSQSGKPQGRRGVLVASV
ncbi:hypothetical protein LX32DRAFT_81504 [Colletotrichum zoysiae]|uniref:Uncharacterized protein n=1 Tax=Colletotrichum zoysiae TaxID=1216348 RepID=A0AAD9HBC9_9PEZI|nr:hypothetical protein LX32DRAFT_81504 [Colletotrichum zoysiae]